MSSEQKLNAAQKAALTKSANASNRDAVQSAVQSAMVTVAGSVHDYLKEADKERVRRNEDRLIQLVTTAKDDHGDLIPSFEPSAKVFSDVEGDKSKLETLYGHFESHK